MRFDLVDRELRRGPDSIVTLKLVSAAEEYLQDHFPGYPVLPGVLMLEAMVQAARRLIDPEPSERPPVVLGRVRALRYGRFVRPGDALRVEITGVRLTGPDEWDAQGKATVINPGEPAADAQEQVAASGRLSLRRVRLGGDTPGVGG